MSAGVVIINMFQHTNKCCGHLIWEEQDIWNVQTAKKDVGTKKQQIKKITNKKALELSSAFLIVSF